MQRLALTACLLFITLPVLAQDELDPDEENCTESKYLGRMPGCRIASCTTSEFDSFEIAVGVGDGDYKRRTIDGSLDGVTYECPSKTSKLQIQRNADTALRTGGYEIVAANAADDVFFVTGKKGGRYLEVTVEGWGGHNAYVVRVVTAKEMAQELTADADTMAAEIAKSGHVAVYGIQFDVDKSTLKPESESVLKQVQTLLERDADLKLRVEGHTDATGSAERNQKLSEERATSVVTWLSSKGIASERLTSAGVGATKPIGDNATDEGKAKNRRVELVKM